MSTVVSWAAIKNQFMPFFRLRREGEGYQKTYFPFLMWTIHVINQLNLRSQNPSDWTSLLCDWSAIFVANLLIVPCELLHRFRNLWISYKLNEIIHWRFTEKCWVIYKHQFAVGNQERIFSFHIVVPCLIQQMWTMWIRKKGSWRNNHLFEKSLKENNDKLMHVDGF